MKKILLMTASAVVMLLASCTAPQTPDLLAPASTDDATGSRAIFDIFKIERMGDVGDINVTWTGKVDFQGNLYSPMFRKYYNLGEKKLYNFPLLEILETLTPYGGINITDWCFDIMGNILVVGNISKSIQVYMFTPDMNSMVDLTSYYPYGIYGFGICTAENGDIFVSAGGEIRDNYPYYHTQDIYRLDANSGMVEKVVRGIENMHTDGSYCDNTRLMKMGGTFVGGDCHDGRLFKANTNTGEVEYITPRTGWDYMAASNMPNFYTTDGIKIIEIRPNMTTDLVVGTIPQSYIDGNGDRIYFEGCSYDLGCTVNADATVFYIGSFKLTLK